MAAPSANLILGFAIDLVSLDVKGAKSKELKDYAFFIIEDEVE